MSADYRKVVPLPCWDCVIDVVGWANSGKQEPVPGSVNVGLISNRFHYDVRSWRARIKNAIASLLGKPSNFLEFYAREDLENLTQALSEAADVAFP